MVKFKYSYLELPSDFFSFEHELPRSELSLLLYNTPFCQYLGLDINNTTSLIQRLQSKTKDNAFTPFAQAYAGHQFGHFTNLGDGRTLVLGEIISESQRFDLQLKGSGRTIYSRQGDGRATRKAMLREYLMSEALTHLGIPSSRSLAVINTSEEVVRETMEPGAILLRSMKSLLRIGTFEYARYFLDLKALEALLHYTITRHYPSCKSSENPTLAFIEAVVNAQFDLVVDWMRVGFIHGVMNTDNTAIGGETFDYGPCAFMNQYHPNTVFSSIDHQGRYAFGNQPGIIQWNLIRLMEALLPLIDSNEEKAIAKANRLISTFESRWKDKYNRMMATKIGFDEASETTIELTDRLLNLLREHKIDYTNAFASLCHPLPESLSPWTMPKMQQWKEAWNHYATSLGKTLTERMELMINVNPVIIPRNHLVEAMLETGNDLDVNPAAKEAFLKALAIWSKPYSYDPGLITWMTPPSDELNNSHRTYCGT
jgi:uncharacterized protein YdiU (UPF0061 family)